MSSDAPFDAVPPVQIGALLRWGLQEIRTRIYTGVVAAGFADLRPPHVTLFRWPGPEGRRPTEVGADAQISKQRVNDLLRDLESLGYLGLEADPSDNRARIVRLTERGRRLHETAVGIHAEVEREWAARVGKSRYEALCQTLRDLVDPTERRRSHAGPREASTK